MFPAVNITFSYQKLWSWATFSVKKIAVPAEAEDVTSEGIYQSVWNRAQSISYFWVKLLSTFMMQIVTVFSSGHVPISQGKTFLCRMV